MDASLLNILLAEDERAVAFSVVFALKCDGHKVQVVADGEQALASVRVEPDAFNLLITDHSMPGMTGVELVQRLSDASFRGKIMVLSAHLSAENRAAYEALGVDAMVSKPFDVHELRAMVTRLANEISLGWGRTRSRRPLCTTCSNQRSNRTSRTRRLKVAPESLQEQTERTELAQGFEISASSVSSCWISPLGRRTPFPEQRRRRKTAPDQSLGNSPD